MVDLIERLRNPMWCHGPRECDLKLDTETTRQDMVEAAVEIERLRAERDALRTNLSHIVTLIDRGGMPSEQTMREARAALDPSKDK